MVGHLVNDFDWDQYKEEYLDYLAKLQRDNSFNELLNKFDKQFKKDTKMTKDEYLKFHADMCQKMIETTRKKNADYTGNQQDPFANFTKADELGICSTEQGFLVRLTDKLARVISFVQKGILEVKDETVEDTLIDMANYCILMAGYIKSRRKDAK